jgi:hypothetical protein
MAMEAKMTRNVVGLNEYVQPILVRPGPVVNLIPPAPAPAPARAPVENSLNGALTPAFLLMLLGSCFIINPLGHGSAIQDEAFLAFCLFLFGGFSLFCRSFLLARFPLVANVPASIVQFIHNCIFGHALEPAVVDNS